MRKMALPAVLLALVIGASVGVFAALGQGSDDPAPRAVDISGNCDEAEHAADPECSAVTPPGADDDADRGRGRDHPEDNGRDHREDDDADDHGIGDDDPAGDISGNCDEAEHAADPECTGAAPIAPAVDAGDDDGIDNSGPGSTSSGPGSSEDQSALGDDSDSGEDSSGPGSGDDSGSGEDSSGPGSGDDD